MFINQFLAGLVLTVWQLRRILSPCDSYWAYVVNWFERWRSKCESFVSMTPRINARETMTIGCQLLQPRLLFQKARK